MCFVINFVLNLYFLADKSIYVIKNVFLINFKSIFHPACKFIYVFFNVRSQSSIIEFKDFDCISHPHIIYEFKIFIKNI